MTIVYGIAVFCVFALFVFVQFVRIHLFKKESGYLLAGLISMLLLTFSLVLVLKYGLVQDYGLTDRISLTNAQVMQQLARVGVILSLSFIGVSLLKWIIGRIKGGLHR